MQGSIHAENRIQPDAVLAQTGLMQGAAGIGLFLLHLDVVERGREWTFALPDSPWEEAAPAKPAKSAG